MTGEGDGPMRTSFHLLVAILCLTSAQVRAAEPAPVTLTELLKATQAIASLRVTHTDEELRDDQVLRTATLTVCGRASGLGEQTQLEISWTDPAKTNESKPDTNSPAVSVGKRCVVLLANRDGHWAALRKLNVSPEGKVADDNIITELGLTPGCDADAAVLALETQWKKTDRRSAQRIAPPPPSARNQPWKLMRASPLRRIWPFFPH